MNFYLPASGQVLSDTVLLENTGFHPDEDPGALASNGIYTVVPTPDPYDPNLYTSTAVYTVVGDYANQSWTATPLPLATAQANGIVEVKAQADTAETDILANNNITLNVMTAVAGQLQVDRPADLQTILAEMQVASDLLGAQIGAINAAATVDEINNIVNPPTGTIQIYRTGTTLEESFYVSFNSITLTESDTELYIPGSATVIPYDTLNSNFPQTPSAFSPGDFLIQIRVTSSAQVIKEFLVDTAPTDVAF